MKIKNQLRPNRPLDELVSVLLWHSPPDCSITVWRLIQRCGTQARRTLYTFLGTIPKRIDNSLDIKESDSSPFSQKYMNTRLTWNTTTNQVDN